MPNKSFVFLVALSLLTTRSSFALVVQATAGAGTIRGTIRGADGPPVAGARVRVLGIQREATSDENGAYRMVGIPTGRWPVQVSRIGYALHAADTLDIAAGETVHDVTLQVLAIPLSQVVISPGAYSLLEAPAPSMTAISRETLQLRPTLAEDLFRSINRLPGVSGSDYSAKVRIRNGGADEQLVLLDGLELIEPYHLKDFDGALSALDVDVLGGINVITGGFGTRYGNRMAGVMELSSAWPREGRPPFALGLSLSNFRARTEGTFDDGQGAWLLSARRGYLDIVLKLVGEENPPSPVYYDVFAKSRYTLGGRHVLTCMGWWPATG